MKLFLFTMSLCLITSSAYSASENSTQPIKMTVYRGATCNCCLKWVAYLEKNGFKVDVKDVSNLSSKKDDFNVPKSIRSCHTGVVDGKIIEGHIPADAIKTFLTDKKSTALGISVAGMPLGSPGMEVPGRDNQPFDVISFDKSGKNLKIYESYKANWAKK